MEDLTRVWTVWAWSFALLTGMAFGGFSLYTLTTHMRMSLDPLIRSRQRTSFVVAIFLLSAWGSFMFWGGQTAASILSGDPAWTRTLSRAGIETVGFNVGIAIGMFIHLGRMNRRKP